ncbi:MAG: hypothetical protein N2652_03065 [Kiritimatiellae bacterium]|nr:hypothetical protein [Kiritimatiellia bacterium]
MRKANIGWLVVAAAVAAFRWETSAQNPPASPPAQAPAQAAAQEPAPKLLTHGELAQLLVRKLGLYRFVAANPTDVECMILLAQNGVFPSPTLTPTEQNPAPGWSLDPAKEVSLADLAVVLVRALRLEGQVEGDKGDPQNWLKVLKDVQVPTDTVGAGLAALSPLADALQALPLFSVTPEPLARRYLPESTAAALINTIAFPDVAGPRRVPPPGPPPRPVTPT